MIVLSNVTVLGFGRKSSFQGSGGVAPYTYAVLPGGVGGTIDSNGLYTAASVPGRDTIEATDSLGAKATASISVLGPLELVCDVIQKELGLPHGRVWIWNQKKDLPIDKGIYVAVSITNLKVISNSNRPVDLAGGISSDQNVAMRATVSVDIISRDTSALDRKEEVLMAMSSTYSQNQQTANSFKISQNSSDIIPVSSEDGAAIPYRFNFSFNMFYAVGKTKSINYFEDLQDVEILTNQ